MHVGGTKFKRFGGRLFVFLVLIFVLVILIFVHFVLLIFILVFLLIFIFLVVVVLFLFHLLGILVLICFLPLVDLVPAAGALLAGRLVTGAVVVAGATRALFLIRLGLLGRGNGVFRHEGAGRADVSLLGVLPLDTSRPSTSEWRFQAEINMLLAVQP